MTDKQFNDYYAASILISALLEGYSDGKKCRFFILDKTGLMSLENHDFTFDTRGHQLIPGDWYIEVECRNGYKYYINVTADSVITMAIEVLKAMEFK